MKYGRLLAMVCLLLSAAGALAAHWTVNPHGFQYDMTAYVVLQTDGKNVGSYGDLEVAAFCNGECRGVAKVQTGTDGSTYLYMRIRSNEQQDKTISFRVYQSSSRRETDVLTACSFEAGSMWGTPGTPKSLVWNSVLYGDANDDGWIDITDVTATISHLTGQTPVGFSIAAADMNGDGYVTYADVAAIAHLIVSITCLSY